MGATRGSAGSVRYQGKELTTASAEELQAIRGDRIAMVFQDPMSSFNPVHKIGDQIVEAIQAHREMPKDEARRRAVEALCAPSASRTPRPAPATIRSSSPAACASGR